MADFCSQCATKFLTPNQEPSDGDFVGLTTPLDDLNEIYAIVLCEGMRTSSSRFTR